MRRIPLGRKIASFFRVEAYSTWMISVSVTGHGPSRAFTLLALAAVTGCGHELVSRNPDPTRKVAPVPACVHYLDPRGTPAPGLMRTLTEDEYWRAAFDIEPSKPVELTEDTPDCRGEPLLNSEKLSGANLVSSPFSPKGEEIVFGGGPDRLRVAWLRTHRTERGESAGPLIMIRAFEQTAEVYGVGLFRGSERTRFVVQRSGDTALVLAKTDDCSGNEGIECETTLDIFQQRLGALDEVGSVLLERVAFAQGTERGVDGSIKYHLTSVPYFEGGGIRLHEQMTVTDAQGREFRRGEMDRYFDVREDRLELPAEPSLWDRFFVAAKQSTPENGEAPRTGTTVM